MTLYNRAVRPVKCDWWLTLYNSAVQPVDGWHFTDSLHFTDGWHFTHMWKTLAWPHHFIKIGGLAHKSSLTSRLFIEVHVPSNENERSRLLGILILALSTIVLIDTKHTHNTKDRVTRTPLIKRPYTRPSSIMHIQRTPCKWELTDVRI